MGASSPRRENLFHMRGLAPGLSLIVEVEVAGRQEELVTKVEEVTPERLAVLVPMVRLRARPLRTGSLVRCSYIHKRRRFRFVSEVVGHSADGHADYLSPPVHIEDSERRNYYRLETALKPLSLYRVVVDSDRAPEMEGTVVDLSEGGCCIASRAQAVAGERLGLQLELPGAGTINVRMRVTSIRERQPGYVNHRIHCLFTDISMGDRDLIARYLMRRQLEMRRRGQL